MTFFPWFYLFHPHKTKSVDLFLTIYKLNFDFFKIFTHTFVCFYSGPNNFLYISWWIIKRKYKHRKERYWFCILMLFPTLEYFVFFLFCYYMDILYVQEFMKPTRTNSFDLFHYLYLSVLVSHLTSHPLIAEFQIFWNYLEYTINRYFWNIKFPADGSTLLMHSFKLLCFFSWPAWGVPDQHKGGRGDSQTPAGGLLCCTHRANQQDW